MLVVTLELVLNKYYAAYGAKLDKTVGMSSKVSKDPKVSQQAFETKDLHGKIVCHL